MKPNQQDSEDILANRYVLAMKKYEGITRVITQIRKRKRRYIGHVLREKPDYDQCIAFKCTSDSKHKRLVKGDPGNDSGEGAWEIRLKIMGGC